MKIAKKTLGALGAFALSSTLVHGQARLYFEDIKRFKQIGPTESEYLGGRFDVTLIDGSFTILGCFGNGGLDYIPPVIGCPAGTTALIESGDIDGDGLRDGGRYYSITDIIPAIQVEPYFAELSELYAAPPSTLPRPDRTGVNFIDDSLVIFWDLVGDPTNTRSYIVTRYRSSRPYTADQLELHRSDIIPGVYYFKFPMLGSDADIPRNFFMQVGHREMVEAYPGPGGRSVEPGGISVGNDFRLKNDDAWVGDVLEIDPRIGYELEWEGFNTATFLGNDRLFFSVIDRQSGDMLFPPYPPGNATYPQLIGDRTLGIPTSFRLGPAFFEVGENVTAEIEFARANPFGNAEDRSRRNFFFDINFVDTYDGFVLEAFPQGVPESLLDPEADADGDGFSNLTEFALQADPADPASVPLVQPYLDGIAGFEQCVVEVPKRPFVGNGINYAVEYSSDLENWTRIEDNDPYWYIELDNEDVFKVRSILPFGQGSTCLTRVVISLKK